MKILIKGLIERLKESLVHPSGMFKYKDDPIETTLKYVFLVIAFIALLVFIFLLSLVARVIPEKSNPYFLTSAFPTFIFALSIFEIGISLMFLSGLIAGIIYLFSNNPNKNLQDFFKINCYIISCSYIQSAIFFLFLPFLFFLSFINFLLPVIILLFSFWILGFTVFSLIYAYKGAENY